MSARDRLERYGLCAGVMAVVAWVWLAGCHAPRPEETATTEKPVVAAEPTVEVAEPIVAAKPDLPAKVTKPVEPEPAPPEVKKVTEPVKQPAADPTKVAVRPMTVKPAIPKPVVKKPEVPKPAVPKPTPAAVLARVIPEGTCTMVDLTKLFNNDGISSATNKRDGDIDTYKQSFCAELLPKEGKVNPVKELPELSFLFPSSADGAKNNVSCAGQKIGLAGVSGKALYLLGTAVNGSQTGELTLGYGERTEKASFTMADWCAKEKPAEAMVGYKLEQRHDWRGQLETITCWLWVCKVNLDPEAKLAAVALPDNKKIHLFALSLAK